MPLANSSRVGLMAQPLREARHVAQHNEVVKPVGSVAATLLGQVGAKQARTPGLPPDFTRNTPLLLPSAW